MSIAELLLVLGIVILVYMSAWFALAVILKRNDVADSAWGLGFVVIAVTGLFAGGENATYIQLVATLLIAIWGLRLFWHVTKRSIGRSEDARYEDMRKKWGSRVLLKSYSNVFLLQGILMLVVSAPVIAIMHSSNEKNSYLVLLGFLVWLFGIVFEAIADRQLRKFITHDKKGHEDIMNKGLWRYSRHPNYFGEISVWWGAAIVALSLGQWWGFIGAVTITILIVKVSGIPLLEKRYERNNAYQQYKKKTSILIPLPRRS